MAGAAGEQGLDNLRLPLWADGSESDGEGHAETTTCQDTATWLGMLVLDTVLSVTFWNWLLYFPDKFMGYFFAVLVALIFLWRVWRHWAGRFREATGSDELAEVPYSCGFVKASGKELFLVATVHISPRAPRDVKAVIGSVKPDVALIELDEERLDRLRDVEEQKKREAKPEDLQPIEISYGSGSEPVTVRAQRALWNAERAGERISGRVVFEPDNAHGLSLPGESARGQLLLVHRGGSDQRLTPFAVKAHRASKSGVEAVLVINSEDKTPVHRLGGQTLSSELRVAFRNRSCGFPQIPVFLLSHTEGERLREKCQEGEHVRADLEIMQDDYPRRTLPKRLCQGCALMFSGIGILYGIIGCFGVEVGAEFTEAEVAATSQGIQCACIDVNMNRFWARLGATVLPTPCNILNSFLSWLAFPRVLLCFLFPPRGNVDLLLCMLLHLSSLPVRTWIAFILAGFGASTVATWTLQFFGSVSERGAEEAGVVKAKDRSDATTWIMLLIEAYLIPQICQGVASSRDEAMYKSIVAKGRELNAQRLVAVVGGGHANGILHHARTRGL